MTTFEGATAQQSFPVPFGAYGKMSPDQLAPVDQEPCPPYHELWEEVVVNDGEGKLEATPKCGV
jgi:hypothetical protein